MRTSRRKKIVINILCRSRKYRIPQRTIRTFAMRVLRSLNSGHAEISICFVSNPSMRKLNRRYKKRDTFTDVLAFLLSDKTCGATKKHAPLLGEIVISLDQTKRNAKRFGTSYQRELFLYVIHGLLHLLGYNDGTSAERKRMERKQIELLEKYFK